jgi:riboflavin kinase/FMN adenylyltransferase
VVRVRFLHRLRDERKFASIDELKEQIDYDARRAAHYFTKGNVRRSLTVA